MKQININTLFKAFLLACLVMIVFVLIPEYASARPGGGHGYHGGSRGGGYHSSGRSYHSGSGSGGGIFIFGDGASSIVFYIVVAIVFLLIKYGSKSAKSEDTVVSTSKQYEQNKNFVKEIKRVDPFFSKPVFLDFASSLFFRYYSLYSKDKSVLTPFFQARLLQSGNGNKLMNYCDIEEITLGSARISSSSVLPKQMKISVVFEANYTLVNHSNDSRIRCESYETWIFVRNAGVISQIPQGLGVIRCPHCGASADFSDSGKCKSCGNVITPGTMQWSVENITFFKFDKFNSSGIFDYNDGSQRKLPTVQTGDFNKINIKHKDFINQVTVPYFLTIYDCWTNLCWNRTLHLMSQRLWESYSFFINLFVEKQCRNVLEDIRIEYIEPANYEVDNYYESVTVRIFASCRDYVINKDGKKVAGYNGSRKFNEYWTFVRSVNVEDKRLDLNKCPSCGGPLDKMGQAGMCGYCNCRVTDGNFSWVLFSIDQETSYYG